MELLDGLTRRESTQSIVDPHRLLEQGAPDSTQRRVIAEVARRYFAAFFSSWRAGASREGCLASARRSVFFRRLARFLALSLPLLCPINVNLRPVVVL